MNLTTPFRRLIISSLAAMAALSSVQAQLRLPALFSDHMLLQAGRPVTCWGWAKSGDEVDITFNDAAGKSLADVHATAGTSDGRWQAQLPALPKNTSGQLLIRTKDGESNTINDVITGEIWLASGQSNMTRKVGTPDFPKSVLETAVKEASGKGLAIRFFTVANIGADTPQDDVRGKWIIVGPDNVATISAVAWNFALTLHNELQTPAGMIVSAYGGTPVEAWIPRASLDATTLSAAIWKRHAELVASYPAEKVKWDQVMAVRDKSATSTPPREPYSATCSRVPVRLFNAMINGLVPYTIQGVIWYQGEENASHPSEYPELIQTMVKSWRKLWATELPFYYVELANIGKPQKDPSEGGWALIREAQQSVLKLPKTAVATAVDVGDGHIHPWNKKAVGNRLAALALANVYGHDVKANSPQFSKLTITGNTAHLTFDNAEGLRARGGGALAGFAITGRDAQWKWAEAKIVDGGIDVTCKDVPAPVAVRYGWASNPTLSAENQSGLPLRPFRTDTNLP